MHFLVSHGAQIDKKPELIFGIELLQSHMLGFVFFFHKEAADLSPSVPAFDAIVVQGTKTSFSFSLGTQTSSVSLGLPSEWSKVIRFVA